MSRPVSPLLNTPILIAGLAALALAAWAGYTPLAVLLGLAVSTGLLTKLWSSLSLRSLHAERQLEETRVFPGEQVTMRLRVVNRKLLPLPWVEVRDEIPAALLPTEGGPSEQPGVATVVRQTPLLWYSAAVFTHTLTATTRGYYPLGPLSVTSGDIFGLHPRTLVQSTGDHIIVYPRLFHLPELAVPSLAHTGDAAPDLHIFEDPSRLAGVREYEPGDNPRRIHWKASARRRALQVKLFEFTTDLKVTMFLAVDTFTDEDGTSLELGVSTAGSIGRYLAERKVQTGLFVNTRLADTGRPARIPPIGGTEGLAYLLEALAKTTAEVDAPITEFYERERIELGFGGTLAFVVGSVPPALHALMADLVRTRHRVMGFLAGRGDSDSLPAGVRWHRVYPPARGEHPHRRTVPEEIGGSTALSDPGVVVTETGVA
jgi:uncharacterized protein (DUF58 family)